MWTNPYEFLWNSVSRQAKNSAEGLARPSGALVVQSSCHRAVPGPRVDCRPLWNGESTNSICYISMAKIIWNHAQIVSADCDAHSPYLGCMRHVTRGSLKVTILRGMGGQSFMIHNIKSSLSLVNITNSLLCCEFRYQFLFAVFESSTFSG